MTRQDSYHRRNSGFDHPWQAAANGKVVIAGSLLLIVALVTSTMARSSFANEQVQPLHGLFCNSEAQLDETLSHIRRGIPPQIAVELTNVHGIVCTYADKIQFVVSQTFDIGHVDRPVPMTKFKAVLVGVLVGNNLRVVAPPVQIYFVTPRRPLGASMERGA